MLILILWRYICCVQSLNILHGVVCEVKSTCNPHPNVDTNYSEL